MIGNFSKNMIGNFSIREIFMAIREAKDGLHFLETPGRSGRYHMYVCDLYPIAPHFYKIIVGFTGVCIFFLFFV